MRLKKGITLVISAVVLIAGLLGTFSISHNMKNTREFVADGFILKPSAEEIVTTDVDEQYYFSQGTKYKEKYATKVLFKDKTGQDIAVDVNQFIHYADGSLGSFTKGVLMSLADITEEQLGYYSLTKNTILIKSGNSYEMKSRGEAMELSEFIWKISDTDYMIVSPEVTLHLNDSTDITLPEYAQIKYVDSGIVRIVHQQGTYQTVSADTFLRTQSGAELNLVGKNFYVNGEPALSLDSMSIDDDSYIDLDENVDTPELKIPTFNVINGKDGTSGADGKAGENGEEGVTGEDGSEGEEGVAGAEGQQGAEGANGTNGVEGDTGVMGFDGAEGKKGKDAENAGQTGGVTAADLLARPTVTLNSATGYDVTASTADMQLKMDISSGSLTEGTTSVTIYDRATMNPVYSIAAGSTASTNFESGAVLNLQATNLNPDTEYVLVVAGQYSPENGTTIEGNLFTKIFKTDSLGIIISKNIVTEKSVSVTTKITATNIGSYDVIFFKEYKNDGTPDALVQYTKDVSVDKLVMSDTEPSGSERVGAFSMESNTNYYACIANVKDKTGQLINTGDTTIELKTLKRKPYKDGDETTTISAMKPVITQNIRSHSLIVSMDNVIDPDNGVTGYRYELYKQADVTDAILHDTYASLRPTYTRESTLLESQTFNLETTDKEEYCAKIVAMFNDNEKDVEYGTLFSLPSAFGEDGGRFTVEFVDIDKGYTDPLNHGGFDKISGNIRISDPDNVLLSNINRGTSPLVLTIAGDDISTYTQNLDLSEKRIDGIYTLIPFVKSGLRANTTYTLTVSGPIDSDKDGTLSDVEKLTYLSGVQGVTLDTQPLSLVSYEVNVPSVAFARAFNLTSPVLTGASDEPVAEYYQYETDVLSNIQFKLIHIDDNGIERQIGNLATITEKKNTNAAYNFDTSAWIARNNNIVTQAMGGLTVSSVNANRNAETAGFILTPNSFGLDNSDSVFFGGGQFKIQVTSATDYTTKNVIPFTSGEDVIVFEVVAKHVSATDPNTQIEADLILNDGATSTFEDSDVSEDTAVGIRFRAEYPYSDIKQMIYYIYELSNSDPSTASLDGVTARPGQPGTPSTLIDLDAASAGANPAYGTLVLKGSRNTGGGSGGTSSTPVELYFKNTKSHVNSGTNYTWTLPNGTSADDKDVLKRGKRYFIRYEVVADASVIDCKGDNIDDIYPFCAYEDGITVPCYRSSVLEIEKQMPKVERYPSDSGANSATWKYRIDDPDQAIVQTSNKSNFRIKQYTSAENAISGTGAANSTQEIDLSTITSNAYNAVSFIGLTSGKFYTISIPYQLSTVKAEEELVSIPVPFNALTTSAPTDIRCQGILANANTPVGNTVTISGKSYEKALINESGYRYRINFRGADIPKYAGVRVTIEGGGKSVVYDPVYFQYTGTTSSNDGSESYAYAYLDTAPLSTFTQDSITTALVKVTGYYSTNQSGVDTYESLVDDYPTTKDFTGENVYAIKSLTSSGTVNYKKLSTGNWTSTPTGLVGSLFVPGLSNGSGFTSPVLTNGSYVGTLTQRYPSKPIVVDTSSMGDQSKISIDLLFDQNGMKDTSSNYYMVEKLGVSGNIAFADGSNSLQIADILPAVEENSFTIGARSARLKFNALGTGATPTSAVYAEVYKVVNGIPKLCEVTRNSTTDPVTSEQIYYYEVGDVNTSADYSYSEFNNNKITISSEETNIIADLRLRGLDLGTTYQVKIFSYNSAHDNTYLYCKDKNIIGYAYEFRTKDGVDIIVNAPSYSYINYSTKNAYIAFGISGDDEGTDMDINWNLYNSKDINNLGAPILTGRAEKQSNGSYEYYAQNPADNTAISLDMSPGGDFHLNSGYTIELTAKSVHDDEDLGSQTLSFDTPSTLATPSFLVQTTQSTGKISARVVSTDTQRSIRNDSFTLSLYDEDGDLVGSGNENIKTINRSDDNQHTATVEFTEGFTSGGEYTLKLVADVDLDNNGVADSDQITNEYVVTVSARTQATLGGSANTTELTLNFDNIQGFDNVRKIKITAFDSTNTQAFNGEITSEDSFVSDGDTGFIKTIDWTAGSTKSAGWYKVQVQYRDDSGNPLGNDEVQIRCEE